MNFEALTEFYFTDLLLVICNFLAFLATRRVQAKGSLKIISFYVTISLVFNSSIYLLALIRSPGRQTISILNAIMNIYTLIEGSLIFLFIRSELIGKRLKTVMTLIYSFFALFWIFILVRYPSFLIQSSAEMSGIESFTVVVLCVMSLNSMIKRQKISEFLQTPKFYIMMGIIGYFSYAIPYFLGGQLVEFFSPNIAFTFNIINLLLVSAYFLIIRKGFYAISTI